MPHANGASCATCPAFAAVPPPGGLTDDGRGDCRASRPKALSLRAGGSEFAPGWVRMYPDQWCAEHPDIRPLMRGGRNGD